MLRVIFSFVKNISFDRSNVLFREVTQNGISILKQTRIIALMKFRVVRNDIYSVLLPHRVSSPRILKNINDEGSTPWKRKSSR